MFLQRLLVTERGYQNCTLVLKHEDGFERFISTGFGKRKQSERFLKIICFGLKTVESFGGWVAEVLGFRDLFGNFKILGTKLEFRVLYLLFCPYACE